jgi:type VI secretion system protein ImpJ
METRPLARVVWEEGMHLAQHHFQAQSRFFEDTSVFALSSLFFRPYGFVGVEPDREALLNGTLSLRHGRGFMPDGLPFHFPHDPPPEPLQIRDRFSPTRPDHLVHLAIPAYRAGGANAAPPDEPGMEGHRYLLHREERVDEVSGEDRKPVTLARKNFRLLLDDELEDAQGLVTLPMARITRDGSGSFAFDPEFIPPSLRLGAVPALGDLVDRVLEMVTARADSFRAQRGGGDTARAMDVADMWLGHAIHQSLPALRHLRETRGSHPEALYQELSRLAGALCTFSLDARPEDLPLYDHDNLSECFRELERVLRRRLEVVLPTGSWRVPVPPSEPPIHTCTISDRDALFSARFYLELTSPASAGEVVSRATRLLKVCSAEHIARLVREAFPGLPLTHVTSPPAALRPRPGAHYFELTKSGPCWTSIEKTGELGVYVPDSIAEAALQLVVVPGD